MTNPTNAPDGANTPALPIVWRKLAFPWSTTTAERAIVDRYELMAFDAPPEGSRPRNIGWALTTGPGFKTHVAGGPAASFEAAKAAAEAEVRRIEAAKATAQDALRRKLADNAAHPNDAAIFSAFGQWAQLVREYHATDDEEENDRQLEKVDEAALEVMIYEPETKEGLSAQVYVMLHLEHGGDGRNGDFVDLSFETECILPDHPHAMATNTLLDRVKRLGRQDKGRSADGEPAPELTDPNMAEFAADLQAVPLPVRIAIRQLMRGMVTSDPAMMLTAADKLDCRGEVEAYIERRGSQLA